LKTEDTHPIIYSMADTRNPLPLTCIFSTRSDCFYWTIAPV